jgi:hypothetical protein
MTPTREEENLEVIGILRYGTDLIDRLYERILAESEARQQAAGSDETKHAVVSECCVPA